MINMNPKYHLLVAVAALSLGACSTDDTGTEPEIGGYKLSFTIAEDSETRTTLDKDDKGRDILRWVPTDKVGVYTVGQNANSNTLTTADVSKNPVEFSGTLIRPVSSSDKFYAYYPYDEAQTTDPSAVKLSIPAEQTQTAAGVYNGQSQPLVAVPMAFSQEWGSDACRINNVRFRLLGAIVELQLYSSDEALRSEKIQSVTFEAETPLAGDFTFDLTSVKDTEEPQISGYALKDATTSLDQPAAIPAAGGEAARVYLTIAPGQYTGQIVVKTDVAQYTFRLKNTMIFERAVIKGLPADLAKGERDAFIQFADPQVKQICVGNWWDENSDGELSYKEAAAVTSIDDLLFQAKSIRDFNELQYFTGLQSIGNQAFYNCSSLKSITIPDGVTSIGDGTFSYCSSLTSITIPNGVTSIGNYAFQNCSSLTSINIPDGVTSIGDGTFSYCSSLTSINIPDGLASIGNDAFQNCSRLETINLPDGVTSIGDGTFSKCSSLTSINIPQTVSSIGEYAFFKCSSLSAFYGKYASEDNRCLIQDGRLLAFARAGLTVYTIPDGVTSIGDSAFDGCSGLTSITIPDGVTSIGDFAFMDCNSLTSVYCIPTNPPTLGIYAFYGTSSSMQIYVPTTSVDAYKTAWSSYASQILADNN